jgi:hypothetical protein
MTLGQILHFLLKSGGIFIGIDEFFSEPRLDYRVSPADKSNMAMYLFGGFERCLYPVRKSDSDPERKLAERFGV